MTCVARMTGMTMVTRVTNVNQSIIFIMLFSMYMVNITLQEI